MRKFKFATIAIAFLVAGLWFNNTSVWTTTQSKSLRFIAHRGAHQLYAGSERSNDTCRAEHIEPIEHNYIENTLPSIHAAMEAGATIVEIDVHLTADNIFAVFHDWRLDCQTNGAGVTEEQEFAYLSTLDIGFGFTSDGINFPFRGKALGPMPSLSQVLDANVGVQYFINFKSNRRVEGEQLAKLISNPQNRNQIYGVYGGEKPTRAALANTEGLRGFDKRSIKACLKSYVLIGWAGTVPPQCQNTIIAVPINYAPYLWGWPHKFIQRMESVGTDVILLAPYDGSGFTSGFDDASTLSDIPAGFSGYVWTNRILSMKEMLGDD